MDRPAPAPPSRRDVVFCYECEHEWYRDEHGLTCPDCQSDFVEIVSAHTTFDMVIFDLHPSQTNHRLQVEPDNDPRIAFSPDEFPAPGSLRNSTPFDPGNAPDPDIDDINDFHWMGFPPRGGPSTQNADPGRAEANRNFQNTFSGLLAANAGPRGGIQGGQWTTRTINFGRGRRISSGRAFGANTSRAGTVTFTSSTLYPRNASGPQPGAMPVENLANVLSSLFMGLEGPGGPGGPGGPHGGFVDPRGMPGMPPAGANPLGAFFNAIFNPASAQHGNFVYSQEALDRVISELMEQNAMGNAPGPASAEAMANLPKVKVTKDMMGDNGKAECSICMDEVHLDDEVSQLPCRHWFHEQCVKAWLGEHDTCPHCRKGIGELAEQRAQGTSRSSSSRHTSGRVAHYLLQWLLYILIHLGAARVPIPPNYPMPSRRASGLGPTRSSRRPSETSSRRTSETGHGGGGGGLLDRARSLFGGRRESSH